MLCRDTANPNTARSIMKDCLIQTQSTDTSVTSSIAYAYGEDGVFVEKCNYLDLKATINLSSLQGSVCVWMEMPKSLRRLSKITLIFYFTQTEPKSKRKKGKGYRLSFSQ